MSRVLPSATVANSLTTLNTLPRTDRAHVLYNPIVPDAVDSTGAQVAAREGPFVVGMIGRLTPWKGQDVFLHAFAKAFRGQGAYGRIIGSAMFGEDAYVESLRLLTDELGISHQIEFRGFRPDVWAELAEVDVLVHCSTTPEPFGQVVLEGMAAGVAVIATRVGGPAELISDGVSGLLTTPRNPEELANALSRLRDDVPLRMRLARHGQQRSRQFTPKRSATQLLEIYRVAVERHPSRWPRWRGNRAASSPKPSMH
jgi:glycosyltransferase involved in cell wall biosynthesis